MSDWASVSGWVSKFAPMIGTALGGPLGGAAGALLASALGTKDASPESIQKAIVSGNLTGDQILALKKAENDFAVQMADLGFKDTEALANIEFQDRASARVLAETTHDWTPRILAFGVTIGFFGLLIFQVRHEVAPASRDLLNIMIGTLGSAWVSVITYYFGSSAGSREKDATIGKLST